MKLLKSLLFFICISLVVGCGNLPENYGVYLNSQNRLVAINSQKISFKGNLLQSITGLKSPSGIAFNKAEKFIVYLEGLRSDSIQLVKLKFERRGTVNNITRKSNVDVNMWVASQIIPIDIAPVSSKSYMYKISTKTPLNEGFYAIHFGGLKTSMTLEASMGSYAYDFVIGNVKNYPSYENLKRQNKEKIKKEGLVLLENLNNAYNNKKFSDIGTIYIPNGNRLAGSRLDEYVKESEIWFNNAGKVIDYKVIKSNFDEFHGVLTVNTNYEKIGNRSEEFTIKKMGGSFIISEIK